MKTFSLTIFLLSFWCACAVLCAQPHSPTDVPPPVLGGQTTDPWATEAAILARMKAPGFPDRTYDITTFGAFPDGKTDAGPAIAKAIDACVLAGGGHVIVPAGIFLTGPIVIKSRVDLHLEDGATLRFSGDTAKYPLVLTRWEGIECYNYQAFISAYGQQEIGLTGHGTLDGGANASTWWNWKNLQSPDQKALGDMGERGVPVTERRFGAGHYLRPNFFQIQRCLNVLVDGVTFVNAPMWVLHPVLSSNLTIRNVSIESHGPNNDGCDPESCKDVLIENCIFDTGDDCIAIKSGRNADGRRVGVASENIVVRSCRMKDGHGGVVLGSECSGGIRNVYVDDCDMDSPHLDRMLRCKSNAVRGGTLENIFVRNVRVGQVAQAILAIDLQYEEGSKGEFKPVVRNIWIDKVTSTASPRVVYIASIPGAEIDGIHFSNCAFSGVGSAEILDISGSIEFRNVVIEPKDKPESLRTRAGL